jgi:hypothetical protein
MKKKTLDPLIPLDDLKRVVKGLVAVPKATKIEKPKPKSKRRKAKRT